MISVFTAEMHQGVMRKVEIVTYPSNNTKVKRIYDSFDDKVPSDIIWASKPVHLDLYDVIESREVKIYGNR